jgi:hypothetical protein
MTYLMTDGTKATPLSALPPEAWRPVDDLDLDGAIGAASARKLRALVPILSRGLDIRAKAVATIPLRLERRGQDISETVEGKTIIAHLRGLMYRSELGLCLSAAAYWELGTNRAGRNLTPFWLATGSLAEVRDPLTGNPQFQRAGPSIRRGDATPERIVGIYLPSDAVEAGPDPLVAPVRAVLAGANLLRSLDRYAMSFFVRGGVKITLLQVDPALPKPERDKLKTWWDQLTAGLRSAFKSVVISNKVEPKVIGSDPKETAAPQLQKAAREDVAIGLGVPLSLLLSSALAGGTADAERLNFYEFTVLPQCDLILPGANERWLNPRGMQIIGDYDALEVRQWAFAQRARAFVELTGKPILLVDEARARMHLLPLPTPEVDPSDPSDPSDPVEPPPDPDSAPDGGSNPPTTTTSDDPAQKALLAWETKARNRIRRGRNPAVAFESPYLDPIEVDRIRTRLAEVDDVEGVKAAFALPPAGSGLTDAEQALFDVIRPILERYGRRTIAAVLAGQPAPDAAFANDLQAAMVSALTPVVNDQALGIAAGLGPAADPAGLGTRIAALLADQVGRQIVRIRETTRQAVARVIETFRASPGMTRAQLEALLRPTFSARRAEMIAVTEATRGAALAVEATQDYLAEYGLTFVRIWQTSNDDLTCPVCAPLNGQPEAVWRDRFPDGPPAHPFCRCGTTLRPVDSQIEVSP